MLIPSNFVILRFTLCILNIFYCIGEVSVICIFPQLQQIYPRAMCANTVHMFQVIQMKQKLLHDAIH